MVKKNIIAAYGSLREGQYNNLAFKSHFGKDALTLIDKDKLPGYLMYDLGMFPGIIESDIPDEHIVVDYLECGSNDIFQIIEDMELNAGYRADTIFSKKLNCNVTLYVFDDESISTYCSLVENGDWVNYKLNILQNNGD